jgi:hypothetical protein
LNKARIKDWEFKKARLLFDKIRLARTQNPQTIIRNKEGVVVLSAEDFERLTHRAKGGNTLVEFFAQSPLVGSGADLERAPDFGRDVEEFGN